MNATEKRDYAPARSMSASAIGLLLVTWIACRGGERALEKLVHAVDAMPERTIAGRLSGGFAYRPLQPPTRGSEVPIRDAAVKRAIADLIDAGRRAENADAMHRAGEAMLVGGRPREAVELIEQSIVRSTGARDLPSAIAQTKDATALSDLAAAYVAHAASDDSLDLLAAVNAAEHAWQIAQTPDAAWNRALALSAVSSKPSALSAWHDFLVIDPASAWAKEARQRMDAVSASGPASRDAMRTALASALGHSGDDAVLRAVALAPGYARLMVEDDLLPKWGAGDERALADARRVATAVEKVSGDSIDADSVRRIDGVRTRNVVAAALERFGHAREAMLSYHYDAALPLMIEAEALLRSADLALSKRAAVFVATLRFYARDPETSLALCRDIIGAQDAARYPSVTAQCRWNEGTIETGRRNFDRAKTAYEEARDLFSHMSDVNSVAALDVRIEENVRFAGDAVKAWAHMASALRNGAAERGYIPLSEAAKVAEAVRMPFAALSFYDDAVSAARAAHSAAELTDGSLSRARLLRKLGRDDQALAELNAATRFMAAQGDRTIAARLNNYLVVARGEVMVARQPALVVKELEDAVASMASIGDRRNIATARCLQARGNLILRRRADAERSLRAALAELDAQRAAISTDEERLAFVDTGRQAAEMLVGLLFDLGRSEDALRAADAAKGQLLVDAVGGNPIARGDELPKPAAGEAFIDYFVLPDRVLVWSLTAARTRAHAIVIDRFDVDKIVADWQHALNDGYETDVRRRGSELFDRFMAPVWPDIASCRKLIVAADGVLHRVAFAALPDPSRNAFVVEDYDVSDVPSLTWLAAEPPAASGIPQRMVAAVAAHPESGDVALEPLPAAEQDARMIAVRFPGAALLIGNEANVQRVAAAIRDADLFHFAGHAIVDDERPGRSRLVMNRGEPWRASAIAQQKLVHAPIVVLAACSTGSGRVTSDGTASIARAFLLAGSRAAVATLWPVRDDVAGEITEAFYRSLASGNSARAALCTAQRAAIHHERSNARYDWAAFQFIGS
jgi:CHAT domain-containing protein